MKPVSAFRSLTKPLSIALLSVAAGVTLLQTTTCVFVPVPTPIFYGELDDDCNIGFWGQVYCD